VTCGGSASAYRNICRRKTPASRDPRQLARDIGQISRTIKAPSITLGDILQKGTDYAQHFLNEIAKQKIENEVALEFFIPPPSEFLEQIARAVPNFNIQISPESHDEAIRRAFGRAYNNDSLERFIRDALALGCKRIDVFFMIGLPQQTTASVRATVAYCETLLQTFDRLLPFISPLAPFLDPGSRAFQEPTKYGYRLFHRTLEEHRQALLAPSWKYTLNYETIWMSRDELVSSTYEAALELNRLKRKYGILQAKTAERIEKRIKQEARIVRKIDDLMAIEDPHTRDNKIKDAMRRFTSLGYTTICNKDEMNWSTRFIRFHPLRLLQGAFGKS
jgi:B12-binding domain/radical SAM domain protein